METRRKRWSGKWIVAGLLAATASVALTATIVVGCAGTRPTDLGVRAGRLTPCPSSPNCISSQAAPEDDHYAAPLSFNVEPSLAWPAAKKAVLSLPRATIVSESDGYVWIEFTSRVFGFVDDVELALDSASSRIDVRLASRLGHSDLGINRARIEDLRAAFERELAATK